MVFGIAGGRAERREGGREEEEREGGNEGC